MLFRLITKISSLFKRRMDSKTYLSALSDQKTFDKKIKLWF